MTKLRIQAQHRLNFRFLTRKSHSRSSGVNVLAESDENGQKRSSMNKETNASGSKVLTKHLSSITIVPHKKDKDSSIEERGKPSIKMDKQASDSIAAAKDVDSERNCECQEALDVLRRILEIQTPNTTEVYSLSGCAVRIEVLEDTDL